MSIRMGIAVAAGLLAAVGLAGNAGAEMLVGSKAPKPKKVTVSGCATKGTPDTCTMIAGPKGANYNVSGATPPVPVGTKVKLQGTVTDKMSLCGGVVLDGIKWAATKGTCKK